LTKIRGKQWRCWSQMQVSFRILIISRYIEEASLKNRIVEYLPDAIFLTNVVRPCSKTLFPANWQIPSIHKIPKKFPTSGDLNPGSIFCYLRTMFKYMWNLFHRKKFKKEIKLASKKGRFSFSATRSRAPLVGIDRARPCN